MRNKETVNRDHRRPARMKWCEVIRVASQDFLVNARQQACRYETDDGRPLVSGYYLALWPEGISLTRFCKEVRYLGPFSTHNAACMVQASALGFGIVELEMEGIPPPHRKPVGDSFPSQPIASTAIQARDIYKVTGS